MGSKSFSLLYKHLLAKHFKILNLLLSFLAYPTFRRNRDYKAVK